MASAKEIQSRIKSIQDTMKITNAMYMISSSKLKRAKQVLSDTEPYFYALSGISSAATREPACIYRKREKKLSPEIMNFSG